MKTIHQFAILLIVLKFYAVYAEKVKVSIYYETASPNCTAFMKKQLAPAAQYLMNYMDIHYVPFGTMKFELAPDRQSARVHCDYGVYECIDNMIHGCAINATSDPTIQLSFVTCSMAPPESYIGFEVMLMECLEWSGMPPGEFVDAFDNIFDIMERLENKTHAVQPPIKSFPTVIFNDVYDAKLAKRALSDFKGAVCSQIKGEKPAVCTTFGSYFGIDNYL